MKYAQMGPIKLVGGRAEIKGARGEAVTNISGVEDINQQVAQEAGLLQRLMAEIRKVIVGQDEVLEQLLITVLVGGHCLITGLPGTAKTLMVQSLADALGLDFKRIQFTPDLMPTDVTGTDIIDTDPATGERTWRFVPGPIFTNVLLADEINRTPPKTQSALLEAMQEASVTIRGTTHKLQHHECWKTVARIGNCLANQCMWLQSGLTGRR